MTGSIILVGRTADLTTRAGKSVLNTRPAAPDDVQILAELYSSAYQASNASQVGDPVSSTEEAMEVLQDLFDGKFGPFLAEASPVVVDEDGTIVAAALVVARRTGEDMPEDPYLFELFTHTSWRRRGLAEKLVRASASALEQAGHERMSLRIADDNSAALALYLTLNFNRWQAAAESDDV